MHAIRSSLFRLACVPLATSVIASTAHSFMPGLFGVPALLLFTAVMVGWTATVIVFIVLATRRRLWLKAALFVLVLISAWPSTLLGVRSGDYIHLAALYPHYMKAVHQNGDAHPKTVRFYWGDNAVTVLDGLQSISLVYDERENGGPSVVQRMDREGARVFTRHLVGNFYVEQTFIP